jgi:hypothetical protein
MRERPPPETERSPRPGEDGGDQSDIKENDHTWVGGIDEAEPTAANRERQAESSWDHGEPRFVSVFNGADLLGHIAIGRSIRALDAFNVELGSYPTEAEARAAVVRHAFSGRAS